MKLSMLIQNSAVSALAEALTGYGEIISIDHEGTIVYQLEGEDVFELSELLSNVRQELDSQYPHTTITKVPEKRSRNATA